MITTNQKAFSMLVAIVVILIMGAIGAFVLNLSGKIVSETTAQYQKEQAVLLAKSYTELAIMAVMTNDRIINDCIEDIDAVVGDEGASENGEGYQVRVRIGYIGNNINNCAGTRRFGAPSLASPDELNIIVDVYVEYKDINQPNPNASPWITYHRRTLQKI